MAVHEPDPSLQSRLREHECLKANEAKAIMIDVHPEVEQMQNRPKDLENEIIGLTLQKEMGVYSLSISVSLIQA